jgi:hypothetical protein
MFIDVNTCKYWLVQDISNFLWISQFYCPSSGILENITYQCLRFALTESAGYVPPTLSHEKENISFRKFSNPESYIEIMSETFRIELKHIFLFQLPMFIVVNWYSWPKYIATKGCLSYDVVSIINYIASNVGISGEYCFR